MPVRVKMSAHLLLRHQTGKLVLVLAACRSVSCLAKVGEEFAEVLVELDERIAHEAAHDDTACLRCEKEGAGALFAGLAPRIAKVAPSCAIMIASFETGKRWIEHGVEPS